jgi:hypothetical protein
MWKNMIGKDEEKHFKEDCTFPECANCFGEIVLNVIGVIKCFHHHLP